MMKPLGLGYQKIDTCPNFCMLYYLKNAELIECMTCGHSRYKPRTGMGKTLMAYKKLRYFPITPRPQRLFMAPRTVKHMTWHQSHDAVDGVMVHPSNDEAWKHFNSVYLFSWIKECASWVVYIRIQPIRVIWYSLFLLAGHTHNLQLATRDVYEAEVHVFIYGDTRLKQSRPEYRYLSLIVDWWIDAVAALPLELWLMIY